MSRLASQEKFGYFPTQEKHINLIKKMLIVQKTSTRDESKVMAIDPCCGCGLALSGLFHSVIATSYGCEISEERAMIAEKRLGIVINSPRELLQTSTEFDLVFNNPPYDEIEGERLEHIHFNYDMGILKSGGIWIGIFTKSALTPMFIQNCLAPNFSELIIRKYPDPDYSQFRQWVIIGKKSVSNNIVTNEKRFAQYLAEFNRDRDWETFFICYDIITN